MSSISNISSEVLAALGQMRCALRTVGVFPYREDLRSVMEPSVLSCRPEDKLRAAVKDMADRNISSAIVVDADNKAVGIITERDVMRRVMARPEVQPDHAIVRDFMTPDPVTLKPTDTIYRALSVLTSRVIKHLPIVDEEGRLQGIVTMRQLMKLRHPEPMTLIEQIALAHTALDLRALREALPDLAERKVAAGVSAYDICTALAFVNQDIHRRAFEIAIEATGPLPVPCCLVLSGSHGRLETLPDADQDHTLIIDDSYDHNRHAYYFIQLAENFTALLDDAGYRQCDDFIICTNPLWRKTLSEWKEQVSSWLRSGDASAATNIGVVADSKAAWGEESLHKALLRHLHSELKGQRRVVALMYEIQKTHPAPLGAFGRIITEREGEFKGGVDVKKRGAVLLMEGARILALINGVEESSTLGRLEELVRMGGLHKSDAEYFEAAYRVLVHFALEAQLARHKEGKRLSSYVMPRDLTHREKDSLLKAMRGVKMMQTVTDVKFGELVL